MPDPKAKPIRVGDLVGGKYRVERLLGEGGIGMVVQARHLDLRQPVAIKVLLLHDDEEQVVRFMREARASVRLRSEHVARVTDVGRLQSGAPFMVMEYLEGEDLGALVARGPLPIPQAAALLLQACEGIAEAHALGIVHRDLKPHNLFLTRGTGGRPLVKVLDFGLAKTRDVASMDALVTRTMTIAGSPPFMSPEQIRALRDVDARTDIWSLGVCLYALVTSRLPFESPTIPEICARVLKDPPTPIEHWMPDAPEEIRGIIDRALAKDREQRFQDIAEFAEALDLLAPSRGAADRVREVFLASPASVEVMPSEPPLAVVHAGTIVAAESDTRTAFQEGRERSSKNATWLVGAVLVSATAAGVALFVNRHPLGSRFMPAPVGERSSAAAPLEEASDARSVVASPARENADAGHAAAAPSASAPARPAATSGPRRAPKPPHPESTRM